MQTQMRGFLALAVTLGPAALGVNSAAAQTAVLPMPSIPATSPLAATGTTANSSQNPAIAGAGPANPSAAMGGVGAAYSPACSSASPIMPGQTSFDGGGLIFGPMTAASSLGLQSGAASPLGAQSSTASPLGAQSSTASTLGAQSSTVNPCGASAGSSVTASGVAAAPNTYASSSTASLSASAPNATTSSTGTTGYTSAPGTSAVGMTGLGMTGLGTGGLGTAGLGTAGLVSTAPVSGSSGQPTASLADISASAALCPPTNSGVMSGGTSVGRDPIGVGAGGTVSNLAQTVGGSSLPDPAQVLTGSANVPALAPACASAP
jgi:collagen type VII alpha